MRRDLRRIYDAAIEAAAPAALIERALDGLAAGGAMLPEAMRRAERILIVAAGKAALAMARALVPRCGAKLSAAVAVVPRDSGFEHDVPGLRIIPAGHPMPDAGSLEAAETALAIARSAAAGDLLIVALSGGASAMLAMPAERLALDDKIAVSVALMRSGAPIRELNTVRKHLSAIKGGRLLAATDGAAVVTLALSDVIGNDLATIGSGPAVADPTTYAEAVAILKRRKVWGRTPEAVRDHLERGAAGEMAETLKPGDPRLVRATAIVIGDNATAIDGAAREATALGYRVRRWDGLTAEAEAVGRAAASELLRLPPRSCLVAGGEPVVAVRGPGQGGRAQHCALAAAVAMAEAAAGGSQMALLVAGTDGIDGPTDAAGAFADPTTVARSRTAGFDPELALRRNDSYPLFAALDDLLITGPSGTNVADLMIGLAGA